MKMTRFKPVKIFTKTDTNHNAKDKNGNNTIETNSYVIAEDLDGNQKAHYKTFVNDVEGADQLRKFIVFAESASYENKNVWIDLAPKNTEISKKIETVKEDDFFPRVNPENVI